MKRIGLVAGNISEGLAYQRLHLPMRHLRDEYEFVCFDLGDMRHCDAFYMDAVIVCHAWAPQAQAFIEKAKFWYGLKVFVDIDDLLHNVPSDHPDYSKIMPYQKVAHILQSADHVSVSTKYLQESYGHLNKNITVIQNTIDKRIKEVYRPQMKPYRPAFCVGWTGGQSHRSDQFEMLNGLDEFLTKTPEARGYFHLLCPQVLLNKFGAQIHYEPTPTFFLDYPGVAAAYPFDVCTVPLIDHPFNHAKSDLRLLDMAPNDIVLITSPRADFMQHQERQICLYADDNDKSFKSWGEQLEWCYSHPDELKQIAQRAKDYVYNERTSDIAANKWRDIFKLHGL